MIYKDDFRKRFFISFILSSLAWLIFLKALNLETKNSYIPPKTLNLDFVELPTLQKNLPKKIKNEPKPQKPKSIEKPKELSPKTSYKPKPQEKNESSHEEKPVKNVSQQQRENQEIKSSVKTSLPSIANYSKTNKASSKIPQNEGEFEQAVSPPRVIYKVYPKINPSMLSQDEINLKVKFFVRKNGSVRVKLLTPTPNPELNQEIIRYLSKWRFFPAMKNNEPVDSSIDLSINIKVY